MTSFQNDNTFKDTKAPSLIRRPSIMFVAGLIGGMGLGALCLEKARPFDEARPPVQDQPLDEAGDGKVLAEEDYPFEPAPAAPTKAAPMARSLLVRSTPVVALEEKKPEYPLLARREGVQGPVTVTVSVDRRGRPVAFKASESNRILEKAALEAATRWQFRPATVNGQPVAGAFIIHFDFKIKPEPTDQGA